jgi:hypothetical protein
MNDKRQFLHIHALILQSVMAFADISPVAVGENGKGEERASRNSAFNEACV